MSYVPANLTLVSQAGGVLGFKLWCYDTTDAVGDVDAVGYFSDAEEKGMESGDLIYCRIWTTAVPATTAAKNAASAADAAFFFVRALSSGAASTATETAIVVAAP